MNVSGIFATSMKFMDEQLLAEIRTLQSQINDEAVCALARKLKGVACEVEHFSHIGPGALMGCANYHARIRFDDGITWLLRVPRFLEGTTVPVPRAFEYGISKHRHAQIGVTFLLIEELPGKPWDGAGDAGQRAKIWDGLARILVELSRHPFPVAGSLIDNATDPISGVASPFPTSTAYYTAFVGQYLTLIKSGQLYTQYPIGNVGQLIEDDVPGFFLKHVDDKGDHLLVDNDLNITGIIDWQMARVVPWHEAFGPSLVTVNMDDLCNGKVGLSTLDHEFRNALEAKGLGSIAYKNEKLRRFF
ncbi:hypothetical protein F4781DRAFT_445120 [Annulohypoxylon bovei var. microspora]|nr:hypothetical protein F4781DRAFT_445120 [Annulohypoxylon bovei var. microspora]